MSGEHRLAPVNDLTTIGLECIRGVIQRNCEQDTNEQVSQPIYPKLEPRIVDHPATLHEARSEYGIPALIENAPVPDDIAAIIGFVGHHDDDCVPAHHPQTMADGAAESMGWAIGDQP